MNPQTGQIEFLIGIKEKGENCEPLTQEIIIDTSTGKPSVEIWDRSKLTGARPSEVVAGDNGLYSMSDLKGRQSTDLNFDGR